MHAEPELAGSLLVLEDEGCGDATWYDIPGDGDDALGRLGKLGEGVRVEVEVVGSMVWESWTVVGEGFWWKMLSGC